MIRKLSKAIRRNLLKVDWIKAKVKACKEAQEKRKEDILYAKIMHAGGTARDLKPTKLDHWDALPVRADDGMYEEYANGKVVGRGYIDTWNWGSIDL